MTTSREDFLSFLKQELDTNIFEIIHVKQGFLISKDKKEPVLFRYDKSSLDIIVEDLKFPILRVFKNLKNSILKELE